jgi:hypothetical protein
MTINANLGSSYDRVHVGSAVNGNTEHTLSNTPLIQAVRNGDVMDGQIRPGLTFGHLLSTMLEEGDITKPGEVLSFLGVGIEAAADPTPLDDKFSDLLSSRRKELVVQPKERDLSVKYRYFFAEKLFGLQDEEGKVPGEIDLRDALDWNLEFFNTLLNEDLDRVKPWMAYDEEAPTPEELRQFWVCLQASRVACDYFKREHSRSTEERVNEHYVSLMPSSTWSNTSGYYKPIERGERLADPSLLDGMAKYFRSSNYVHNRIRDLRDDDKSVANKIAARLRVRKVEIDSVRNAIEVTTHPMRRTK